MKKFNLSVTTIAIFFVLLVGIGIAAILTTEAAYTKVSSVEPGDKPGSYDIVIKAGPEANPEYPSFPWLGKRKISVGDRFWLGKDTSLF
ncbi:MAG: hypothetical protein WDN09_04275 [bacterium]